MKIFVDISLTLKKKLSISLKCIENIAVRVIKKSFPLKEKKVSISIVICGQQKIRTLNRLYRKQDKITDVLSFSDMEKCPDGIFYLGEIYICNTVAQKQAKQYHHSLKQEYELLIVHSILHLLGFDHETMAQRKQMLKAEKYLISHSSITSRGR